MNKSCGACSCKRSKHLDNQATPSREPPRCESMLDYLLTCLFILSTRDTSTSLNTLLSSFSPRSIIFHCLLTCKRSKLHHGPFSSGRPSASAPNVTIVTHNDDKKEIAQGARPKSAKT